MLRPDTIKLLEENIGKTLFNINHIKFFYDPPPIVMQIAEWEKYLQMKQRTDMNSKAWQSTHWRLCAGTALPAAGSARAWAPSSPTLSSSSGGGGDPGGLPSGEGPWRSGGRPGARGSGTPRQQCGRLGKNYIFLRHSFFCCFLPCLKEVHSLAENSSLKKSILQVKF